MGNIINARYWVAICYPENMVDSWEEEIDDIIQLPFCYCIHDKDHLGKYKPKRKKDTERQRKLHVHIIIAFPNTTTKAHAENVFDLLSAEGRKCSPGAEAVVNIRNKYDYLIHNTKKAKEQKKYLYPEAERIEGNNFDIGTYEQLTTKETRDMRRELSDLIVSLSITNFLDFYLEVTNNFDDRYFDIIAQYSSYFERLIRGCYLKYSELAKKNEENS